MLLNWNVQLELLCENQNFATEKKAFQKKINLNLKQSSYSFPCFDVVAATFLYFFEGIKVDQNVGGCVSSIVIEVIRAILNLFIFFFLQKNFTSTKSIKSKKTHTSEKN